MSATEVKRRYWHPDEEAFLINTFADLSPHEQAEQLKRSHRSVATRRSNLIIAGRLDPRQRKGRRLWSAEEDARLVELLANGLSFVRIASVLRRTHGSVAQRSRLLGGTTLLRRPRNGHQVRTAHEIAILFGVSGPQVRAWIKAKWLKASRISRKRCSPYLITDTALMDFITRRNSWFAWKPERIIDPDWREMATWERRRARGNWLTTAQAAARIGRSRDYVLDQITAGKLPAQRHGRQRYYVWSRDLEALR